MCNEKQDKTMKNNTQYDYRFFDYRINKLEHEIEKGLKKLEQEYAQSNREIMKMLQLVQENNNKQNETLVQLSQRQQSIEEKMQCVEKLKEVATKNTTRVHELERRLEVYKQILFVVGTGVAVALIKAFVFNI